MNGKNNEKNNFLVNSIKASKQKNKYFNTFKKYGQKNSLLSSSKDKRKSIIVNKSENKKNTYDILSLKNSLFLFNKAQTQNYFISFKKAANKKLKEKYNCSKKIYIKLYRKDEIRCLYDLYQIEYLIFKKKCKILSKLNEILLLMDKNEYLINEYSRKESKIFMKYLLLFVYDKDKITYNEKLTNSFNNKKGDSDKENLLEKKEKLKKLIKKKNDTNKLANNKKLKIDLIYNFSVFEIKNCVPNLFPNDYKILRGLKKYLNIKIYQKYYQKKLFYQNEEYKNYMDKSRFNKSIKDVKDDKSKSKILNKTSPKFFKKEYEYAQNKNDIRRVQNDIDTIDIEKLVKKFEKKYKKKVKFNDNNNSDKMDISSQIIKKKLFFNTGNHKDNEVSKDKSDEKIHLSQNSTTLSLIKRDKNNKILEPYNYIPKRIFSNKKKIFSNTILPKKNNINKKTIFHLYSLNNEINKNSNLNSYISNSNLFNSEYQHSNSFNMINNSNQNKLKLIKLKDFIRIYNKTKYSKAIKKIKILKFKKDFEYQPECYIFKKKNNENIWEKGEDLNSIIRSNGMKKLIEFKLKTMKNRSINQFKKCDTLKKMTKFGDIYFNELSSN